MDGLECIEIMLSDYIKHLRLDAEYYSKRNLFLQEKLNSIGVNPMKKYGAFLDCSAFYPSITGYYTHDRSNIPFLRVNEINSGLISITNETVFLPDKVIKKNRATIACAYPGDIIIAKGGNTLAKVGLVTDEFPYYATCRDVIILRTEKLKNLNKYFLWAFLYSSYGQGILWRSASQTGQPHLTLPSILKIMIPDMKEIQSTIERIYKESVELKHQAELLYEFAQKSILKEFKFDTNKISKLGIVRKNLSESFGSSGRLDAEYYQPKYDDLFAVLGKLHTKPLEKIVNIMKSIEPGSEYYGDSGIPFVRVSDVNIMGIDTPSIKIPKTTVPSIENLYPRKDTILFSKDGSVGIAYKVEKDMTAVTSGALLHFHVKNTEEVLPDYLTLVLNSDVVQLQAERDSSGAIIQHWKPSDIEKVVIPILSLDVQRKISEKVQESFSLRRQAESLIQTAIRAVEIAIESDEATALKWVEETLRDLEEH